MKRFMLICVISMLSFTLVLFARSAEPDGVAFDFGEMYVVDGNPKELPHTFEATVYIPEDADTSTRLGTIMSTYTALDTYYFHFDIYSGDSTLFPRFEWKGLYDKSTNNLARSFNFKKAVLEPGNWYHIAIVIDSANAFLHCYIDGEYVQSNSGGIRLADIDARVIDYPIIVGNDNRPYQKFNFKGKIDCIAMFSDVRTPAQINADYKSVGDTDWLFVGLDWGTERREVEWAKEVVEAHPNHKVAIFTHSYLHGDGTTIDEEDTGSYASSRIPLDDYLTGEELWEEFVSQYENIALVFSGHQEFNNVVMTQSKGVHQNTVTQFLIDQQSVDHTYLNDVKEKSPSLVTMFYFSKDGKTVSVEQYSPIRNQYYCTANQITFDMDADVDEQNVGFNGYSIVPSGSGTEKDPYIIENGGNLIWMSNNCTLSSGPSFDGEYFEQVCDIDLNTCTIKSIGYCYVDNTSMAAFGGHYNGNGYSIKNGRIITASYSHPQTREYGDGLFGVICGATVENVVLENIVLWSNGVTGAVVGRAVPSADKKSVISGCTVKSDCSIYSNNSNANRSHLPSAYDDVSNDGVIGVICGMAHGTVIENCVSHADILGILNMLCKE